MTNDDANGLSPCVMLCSACLLRIVRTEALGVSGPLGAAALTAYSSRARLRLDRLRSVQKIYAGNCNAIAYGTGLLFATTRNA